MRKLFFIAAMIAIFSACQKDDETNQSQTTPEPDYFPMAIGNYWVYENVMIDTLGTIITEKIDSVFINRDTLIEDEAFFVFEQITTLSNGDIRVKPRMYYRDSSGYIIDSSGAIFFSDKNFTDTLYTKLFVMGEDSIYRTTYKMEYVNEIVSVPAGDFEVLNFRGTVWVYNLNPNIPNPRYVDNYFAPNVGKVYGNSIWTMSNFSYMESRLLRYNVYLPE
jgi:hypothetical protein